VRERETAHLSLHKSLQWARAAIKTRYENIPDHA